MKKKMVTYAGVFLLLLCIGQTATAQEICGKYDTVSVNGGEYTVQNNVWGADTSQCISVSGTGFTVTVSEHNQGSVASYPSIYKGCHWGECTNNSGMPIQVSNINSAPFSYAVGSSRPSGTYNISAEAWLSPSADSSQGYDGGAEIMIWLDNSGMYPAGSQIGTFDGHDVYYSDVGWNFLTYVKTGRNSASGDIMAFINDAMSRGYIQSSWYLHDFEAGFELMVGGAGLQVSSFSFSVSGGGGYTPDPTQPPVTPDPTNPPVTPDPTTVPTATSVPTQVSTPGPSSAPGNGDGLLGDYYDGTNLSNLVLSRVDPVIDMNWGEGSPDSALPSDNFSIRWTGKIEARMSETYTIHTRSDDGMRVWINNQTIIDDWNDHEASEETEVSGTIYMEMGQQYDITVEYYESGGDASAQLYWSNPNLSKQIVPQSQLYSASGTPGPTPVPTETPAPGAGDVWIVPENYNVRLSTIFSMQIHANTGSQNFAAYGFDLTYDSNYIIVNTSIETEGVEEGPDGFVSAVNAANDGVLRMSGFDTDGTGPGPDLHVVTVHLYAQQNSGTTYLGLDVIDLTDSDINIIGNPNGRGANVTISNVTLGDVNDSGGIDIVDALLVAQYYVGLSVSEFNAAAADTNCDGSINIVDSLLIAQYYVGLISEFC
jgi:hypothetical protein